MSARWGQVVLGPPGSGKTTYCKAMAEFMRALGRTVAIVNLDPANDNLPYQCEVDLAELITVEDAMDKLSLGPNGGLMYCIEYLEKNIDWLESKVKSLPTKSYIMFDCPGQIELYTHHSSLKNVLTHLIKPLDFRLASVHLVDAHYCSDPGKYISVVLTSLATMLQVELPHVNLLSKVDLLEQYGKLAFNIDYYTEVLDLQYMLDQFKVVFGACAAFTAACIRYVYRQYLLLDAFTLVQDDPFFIKYKKLNSALAGLIEDYSLVSFIPLTVQDKSAMANVLKAIDQANGCILGGLGDYAGTSYVSDAQLVWDKVGTVREKYMHVDDDFNLNSDDESS